MKLTQKLAYSQIKANRGRTFWTLTGIVLSTVMITAVFGFSASGNAMIKGLIGNNDYYTDMYVTTLFGVSAVFISIIAVASVIVVSNAFRVSAGERITQFGILKSVGATKKQIAQTIMYEGFFLCLIGIPAGIVLGLLVNILGIQIVSHFLSALNETKIVLNFVLAWQAIILSIFFSFVTVWLSAWLPARKAVKISAIDAIRKTGEVKNKMKRVRSNWLIGKLFGFEGALASKSLKRSRRNFRATVISLTISATLFIIVGAFGTQIGTMANLFWLGIDAKVAVAFNSPIRIIRDDINGEITEWQAATIDSDLANNITEKLREYPNTKIFGVGMSGIFGGFNSYYTVLPKEMLTTKMQDAQAPPRNISEIQEYILDVIFVVMDNYTVLCELAGVTVGSNILVNHYTRQNRDGRSVFTPYVFEGQTLRITNELDKSNFEIPLHGELNGQDIPKEVLLVASGRVTVIVPSTTVGGYYWLASPADEDGFIEYANEVIREFIPQAVENNAISEVNATVEVIDIEEDAKYMRNTAQMIMIFVYGFVGMLTLIGLTNVISTISTNVRSRSREFAVLRSVGMTHDGLKRMLNLESILCSVKSLIIGVPLGIFGSFISYVALDLPVEFDYSIPWLPIIQCTFGVLVVTWVTMRYSVSRLRGGIITEIRENY